MKKSCLRIVVALCTVHLLIIVFPGSIQAQPRVPDHLRPGSAGDTDLSFEKVSVTNRSDTSLTIRWETNRPAPGRIQFGRKQPDREVLRSAHRKRHQSVFRSLTPGTTYRFRVLARGGSGRGIKSQVIEATTTGIPPPRIEKFDVHERTMTGGILRWETNLPTTLSLRAGHDTPLRYRTRQDTPSRFHQVKLNRFYPDQRLFYRVTLTDTRGNTRKIETKSFRTREANYAFEAPVRGTFDQSIYGIDSADTGSTPWNQRITDGQFSYSRGTANSGDPSDTDQSFVVNLGEFVKPGRAVLYWRDLAYPREYEIYGSKTGTYWTRLRANLDADNGTHTLTPIENTKAMKHVVTFADTVDRYQFIRVRIPQGANYYSKYDAYDFVQLHEFKLFPGSIPAPDGDERSVDPISRKDRNHSWQEHSAVHREVIGRHSGSS